MIVRLIIIITSLILLYTGYSMAAEQKIIVEITGITCKLCTFAIKKALSDVKGVKGIKVSHKKETASFTAEDSIPDETLIEAVRRAGPFKVRSIDRKPNK